jgi:hypothetical protein
LKRHLKVHSGDKSFNQFLCSKTFSLEINFKKSFARNLMAAESVQFHLFFSSDMQKHLTKKRIELSKGQFINKTGFYFQCTWGEGGLLAVSL